VSDANLFEQQRINRRRSAIVVTLFLLFFAWVGFGGDLAFYLLTADVPAQEYHHTIPWIGVVATLLGLGIAWYARRTGPKRVLWATGAWELIAPKRQEEKVLINVVEEMAIASGLPVPKIWIVPDKDPNAFATGIDEASAHIAVTEGLLDTLNRDELQGVVAHELAHVRNHDVKLMTLLAALIGVITLMSDAAWRTMRIGGRGRSGGRSGGGGGKKGNLGAVILVLWLITLLVAPILSHLLALGVSRKRELLADASGAQFTRNPGALAAALRKIEDCKEPTVAIGRGSAHLCIADPLGRRLTHKQGFLADLFATHPPMGLRVARLKAMAFQYEKTGVLPESV
jgi:heat shock protein HtpX